MQLPCVGIDISKEWFDVRSHQPSFRAQFEYTADGMKKLLKQLKKLGVTKARFCMEATGLYFEKLAEFLHAHGHEVVVVNPQCIKAYSRSELRRAKSDPLDADTICTYCEDKYKRLHLWNPLPEVRKRAREILRRRQMLVDQCSAEKNRLQAGFSSKEVLDSIRTGIKFLEEEILKLEALALEAITEDEELSQAVELAESIKGVGRLTAAVVLLEVPPVLWDGRLAAVFAGTIPSKNSSGKSLRSSYLSKVGSARLRHALYMPALSAACHNPILKEFYQRLLKKGLHKNQALAAVMRKLLHLIFGVLRSGRAFDPLYESKRRQSLAA